ncbi:TetR family transcriptional regulator [Streptomyces parvulus]|uniref:TetR family transcriptional regulator n=1 Tax=Streptomyces parvulus TaxID=146923 RepID=UPI001CFA50DF|nr:TetR family transcriptional regulator [Streptomyces parvulus]
MRERARSAEDKAQRSQELLAAAEAVVLELGGVRYTTLAAITERAGLHRTGVRRYYTSKEELLLELAERQWHRWADDVQAAVAATPDCGGQMQPVRIATILAETISALPVFCDLLTHAAMSLENDASTERAHRYKTSAFAAHDRLVSALEAAGVMTTGQLLNLVTATISLAAILWQVSHPGPSLAALYQQEPTWAHAALDFEPRLTTILQATATGLARQAAA